MGTVSLEHVLACPNLPSLPAVAMKVLELARNDAVELDEIAAAVQNDPALAAKILRTVNSSYYGLPKPCPSISRALTILGLSTVKSLVLGFSLVKLADGGSEGLDLNEYWRRCLYAAAAARRLAAGRSDAEEVFTAAIMQDLGMLAIHAVDAETYSVLVQHTGGDHRKLPEVERAALGFDHAEVGALLAERWRLPAQITAAIRHHHDADAAEFNLVRSVVLGSEIALAMMSPSSADALATVHQHARDWLGMDEAAVKELATAVVDDSEELGRLFDISTGGPLDINWILAEAQEATVQHQLALQREADDLRKSNDELTRIAITDALTNVGNRERFDDELLQRYQQASAFKGSLGLILADVDRFKRLNDTYGHQIGDAVLVELANRLATAVRGIDLVCRYGGEEFAVVLPGASIRDAAAIAERLRKAIEQTPFEVGLEEPLPVTISAGAAVYDSSTTNVLTSAGLMIKAADQALYVAKDGGRNCVRVFRVDDKAAA